MPYSVLWFHCKTCNAPYRIWNEAKECEEQVSWQEKFRVGENVFSHGCGSSGVIEVISYQEKTHRPLYSVRSGGTLFRPAGEEELRRNS